MMVEEFMAGWADAFTAAEGEGREVELFAAVVGASLPVRPETACVSCWRGGPEFESGEARWVPRWTAWVVLCAACGERSGAR